MKEDHTYSGFTEGDIEVLGIDSLKGLRLEVSPITKQLRKVEALLAL